MENNLVKEKIDNINMWNLKSKNFAMRDIPNFEDNALLKLIAKENMISNESVVLDVGCGAGQYSIALAKKCKKVIGIDISPVMIRIAKEKANVLGIDNIEFICLDFEELDTKDPNFHKKFDLSFANMSPAVSKQIDFQKMIDTSKGWCIVSKHKKNEESISSQINEIITEHTISYFSIESILCGFNFVLKNNYLPKLEYNFEKWNIEKPFDEIFSLCIANSKASGHYSLELEEKIKTYLSSVSVNGLIKENIDVSIMYMYWEV